MSIADNLNQIKKAIQQAAEQAGRNPGDIRLVAVSKTQPISAVREAMEAGQVVFGENKVQELREKQPELPQVQWHMIGSLQRNKVKYIAPFVHLIHSVDSERLLAEISKQAQKHDRVIDCLLQLNISEEDAKSGLNEASAGRLLEKIEDYPQVQILGLMGMAELTEDEQILRNQFGRLRKAFETFSHIDHPRIHMKELSMGMSGDFPIAIEEGATLVRVGSAIFGSRP